MTIQTVGLLDALKTPSNPFPGLRPFESNESHLFFGRDEQIEKMLSRFARTRFLVVVGTSGSGKSSLVRAGLIPALRSGMTPAAKGKWRIAVMRPSNDPIGNLISALNTAEVFGSTEPENAAVQQAITESTLRLGSRGLIEVARQNLLADGENLLVLVDQFEELFRFIREARKAGNAKAENDAADFVKLLLESVKAEAHEANIHVVITMRSDFLGDCSQFWELPETINESQYLVPRLTRDQLREVIEGPVALGGGQIAPRLVNQLLNDIADNQDQLPILQHALMRTWNECKDSQHDHQGLPEVIDLCCYEKIGEMADALSKHADEAYGELAINQREIAQKMFKALTGIGEDNRAIRRPVVFSELCEVTQANPEQVKVVINAFRRPDRSFLMPPAEVTLHDDTPIDILHESLIRNWKGKSKPEKDKRLREWVIDESISAQRYRLLVDFFRWNIPLEDESLEEMLEWQERNAPHPAWARRYDNDEKVFRQSLDYLARQSQDYFAQSEAQDNQQYRHKLIVGSIRGIFINSVVLGFVFFLVFFLHSFEPPPGWPPSSLQNQSFIEWAVTQVNATIYWASYDAMMFGSWIFDWWQSIKNPIIKLGTLFVSMLLAMNFLWLLKQKILRNKLTVNCPTDNLPARPIGGTVNRYLCRQGHQFKGKRHNY
ncbi:MAG: ATP-binding protein [Blastocatellia bacterium]